MSSIATRVLLTTLALGAAVAATVAGPAHAGGATPSIDHTSRITVRPVTSTGAAVDGYTVSHESGAVSCDGQSASAVDPGIDTCYPSAYYVPSCWKSADHSVLCLRNVSEHKLVRIRFSGTFATQPVAAHRSPQALRLLGGATCSIRVGGAWGEAPGHPTWLGFYSCTNGSVYGPPTGDGIDRSQPVWRVHVLRTDGTIVTRRVARATFVGTAS